LFVGVLGEETKRLQNEGQKVKRGKLNGAHPMKRKDAIFIGGQWRSLPKCTTLE